jgi:ABC-type uncharacterized transport system involved in gliding motility auxiliary subunit
LEVEIARGKDTLWICILLFLVLWVTSIFSCRIDLTQKNAYTISKTTQTLLNQIDGNLLVTYYVSPALFRTSAVPDRIIEQLHAYAAASRGKVDIRIENLNQMVETDRLARAGLKTDPQGSYSGIILEYRDEQEVIPWISEPGFVEYLLTARASRLAWPEKRTLGILQGDTKTAHTYESLFRVLEGGGFVLSFLNSTMDAVPPVSALFILNPEGFPDTIRELLDRYLSQGGKLLVCVDGVQVDTERNLEPTPRQRTGVFTALDSWGIQVPPALVLDEQCGNILVQSGTGAQTETFYLPYPPWPSLGGRGLNRIHPVTVGLTRLDLYWASPLRIQVPEGIRVTVLAESGSRSWVLEKPLVTSPLEARDSISYARDRQGNYPVAVLLEGPLGSFRTADSPPGSLIVVGDGDCAGELVEMNQSFENYSFFLHAAEWLSDPEGPLLIRNRFIRDLHLTVVREGNTSFISILQVIHLFILPFFTLAGLIPVFFSKKRGTKGTSQ